MNQEDLPLSDNEIKEAHRVAYLIAGFIRKTLTSQEHRELDEWVSASEQNVQLFERLTDEVNIEKALDWYKKTIYTEKALQKAKKRVSFPAKKRNPNFWAWGMTAAVILLMALGIVLYFQKNTSHKAHSIAKSNQEIQDRSPGENIAVLTLSNGRKIALDTATNGNLVVDGNTRIIKADSGIIYDNFNNSIAKQVPVYNTLSTPNGGTYRLTLPDGTRVWLNAASSLQFPTAFKENERNVELTGEGYFEVSKDPSRPFNVKAEGVTVVVMGTHFNINAYDDDGLIKTTLLEGSVKVSGNNIQRTIKPGEEAQTSKTDISVLKADTEKATGWMQGNFVFHATPLKEVIHNIKRWYNVEIEDSSSTQLHLNATFPRTVPLSKLILYLEGTGTIHFKWEGNKLIVTN